MKLQSKTIVGYLVVLFLLSNCATYKDNSVSLLEAFNSQRKVKITTFDKGQIVYQKIDTMKGKWVGEKILNNNKKIYEPINPKSIRKVQLHRSAQAERTEGLSILAIIFIPVLALVGIAAAL